MVGRPDEENEESSDEENSDEEDEESEDGEGQCILAVMYNVVIVHHQSH
jgi:hypothetical protein